MHAGALHKAAKYGHIAVFDFLVKQMGTQRDAINARNHLGQTPLHPAIKRHKSNITTPVTLQHPAVDINTEDDNGENLVSAAITSHNLTLAESILTNPRFKQEKHQIDHVWDTLSSQASRLMRQRYTRYGDHDLHEKILKDTVASFSQELVHASSYSSLRQAAAKLDKSRMSDSIKSEIKSQIMTKLFENPGHFRRKTVSAPDTILAMRTT